MNLSVDKAKRVFTMWSAAALLLIGACLGSVGCDKSPSPVVMPHEGAPVTAVIEGKNLFLTNNMPNNIYHIVYPTDILPAIEWAPCIAPEGCPAEP